MLEGFQELSEEITDFAQVGLLNSEVAQAERYTQAMELSACETENFSDGSDELICELPEFESQF